MSTSQLIYINGKELYIEVSESTSDNAVLFLHGGPGESCFEFNYHQANKLGNQFKLIAMD